MSGKRDVSLDLLRIFSVFCMIMLHVAGDRWAAVPPSSFHWQILNVYDSLVRFCVPVFVMISGFLFLNPLKEIEIKNIFKRNIFRMVTAFIFWSLCYSLYTSGIYGVINSESKKLFVNNFLIGHFHLWFLFMIVGLYLITPFLRKITTDKKLTKYFLILAFIFGLLLPVLKLIPMPELARNILASTQGKLGLNFVMGYTVFFVGGFYFGSYEFSKSFKRIIYLLGVLSVLFTIFITYYLSILGGEANSDWYDFLLPNTAFAALAVFLFFKTKISKISFSERQVKIISLFSKCSFGIYLTHGIFLIIFSKLQFSTMLFNPVLSVPIISLAVFAGSFILTYLITKIPLLNRYIV